ncbi:MAG TPA: hypothetical protein VGV38_15285, partial [Pyrinomonadaceae bacterium]|nr:hypothetical protein [Pyrinomonadaceae bacterium]
ISGKVAGHMWGYARVANSAALRGGEALEVVPGWTTMAVQLTKALKQEYELANFVFPPVLVLVAGLGLFRTRWTRERAGRELYLLAFVLATFAGYAVTQANVRSFIPLIPLLVGWVALGIFEVGEWFAETVKGTRAEGFARARGGWTVRLLLAFALTLSLVPLAFFLKRGDAWGDYAGQKRVALWIKAHNRRPDGPVIMSSVPIPGFYAMGDYRKLEVYESYPNMIEQARTRGAHYILINERDFKNQPLRFLLDDTAPPPPELRLLHKYRDPSGYRFFVYELAGP